MATLPPAGEDLPGSSSPLSKFTALDASKKYTLMFLMSVGATLLVTGASGGRLLKRARRAAAEPIPTPQPKPASIIPLVPTPRPSAPSAVPPPVSSSRQSLLDLATSFPPIVTPQRSLLRQWSKDKGSDLSFWIPNSTLAESSALAAQAADAYDKFQSGDDQVEQNYVDDGFNPALYGAKAFGIATLITFSTFGAGIYAVMRYFGVSDVSSCPSRNRSLMRFQMEGLSLALSHRVEPAMMANRPTIPAWALPTSKTPTTPGEEEENEEHKEGVAYWVEVKETLDREAEERLVERRARFDKLKLRNA